MQEVNITDKMLKEEEERGKHHQQNIERGRREVNITDKMLKEEEERGKHHRQNVERGRRER